MAYDPGAGRPRPKPSLDEPAPVDALLGAAAGTVPPATPEDPPPSPSVTPAPADPPPDALLLNTGLAGAAATVLGLLVLRQLWKRRQARPADEPD